MKWLAKRRCCLFLSVVLVAAACTTGCSSSTALTNERLDPVTSVTIRYSEYPLVFFRAVPGRSALEKDYVDVAPVAINRSGDYRYYIWLGIWTADGDAAAHEEFDSIIISANGAKVRLTIKSRTATAIGASQPIYSKPFSTTVDAYYEVAVDQLRLFAKAAELRLHTGGSKRLTFEPWDNQERGKAALLEFVNGPTY